MRRLVIALAPALLSLDAVGQDLLQCVNPDVVNGLVSGTGSTPSLSVTGSLPEQMSGFQAPEEFELIGTAVRDGGRMTTVAFRTALGNEAAFAALRDSLAAEGWAIEEQASLPQTFNVASQPTNATMCRDAERRSISVREDERVRFASISYFPENSRRACHAEDPRLTPFGPGMFAAMRARMPSFDFPETARAVQGAGQGMGGSGDTVSTSSRIESPDSAASLAEHLGQQMTAQGWSRDASWSGTLSSGSTWTRTDDDGEPEWGTLEVVSVDADVYDVGFLMQTRPM